MNWPDLVDSVSAALAGQELLAGGSSSGPTSLLAALTGSVPPSLRSRLQRQHAAGVAVTGDVEPVVYQNDLPILLLAHGMVDIATQAVTGQPCADEAESDPRVVAIVAVAALSTLRLDWTDPAILPVLAREAGSLFKEPGWARALDSLARRTAELNELLSRVAGDRRQTWRQVTLEDRILAEAVAAAVVGGAASASGVPAQQWKFPFHLFCGLAVSAAKVSLTAIEHWLGIEFLPAPLTAERTASLAALIAVEASSLEQGCGCKTEADGNDAAYAQRGPCRQADHDLREWLPGQRKPGSHAGARYASTLWGWQRRWLGGTQAGRPATNAYQERTQLRPNDVAGSVLARRWLSGDRGAGGPVLLYDRILPEFCLTCGSKVRLEVSTDAAGRTIVRRIACCPRQQLVYRSEFNGRGAKVLKPKLGIIVTWPSEQEGLAGYASTAPLGPLLVCRRSGRYSLSERHCPSAECRADAQCSLRPMHHGWVLLPRSDAWADLRATALSGDQGAGTTISGPDLQLLADIFGRLWPGRPYLFQAPADVWALAQGWSSTEMYDFMALGKSYGLELILRCKEIAQAQAGAKETDQSALNNLPAPARNYEQQTAAGSERVDRDN